MATMSTLNKQLNIGDALTSMAEDFKDLIADLTMSDEQKANRIVGKARNKALAARATAAEMRQKVILIKDRGDRSVTQLESYEDQDARYIELGKKLRRDQKALDPNDPEFTDKNQALEIQIGQVATALKNLRENPAYATLSESFEAAQEAYETARNTANVAETNWKIVKDNLPALVQAFRVYKEAQQARIDAREASEDQFDPSTFMKGMEADLNEAKAALRADEQVDNDLDAMQPVDPAADLLAQFDAEQADKAILAEFES